MTSNGNGTAKEKPASKSQFKATEKWCELIAAFRDGMPTGKHWHMFHWVEDTFSGCEAVEWMFTYLKSCPEFSKVTRENAHQLLQKFLDAGILEELKKGSKGKFEYSSRLYKMVGDTQSQTRPRSNAGHVPQPAKNAVGLANDGYQSDSDLRSSMNANSARSHVHRSRALQTVQQRPITEEDVHLQWKMAVVSKFEDMFGRGTASQLIDMKLLSGAHVFFNSTHVAANGMLSDLPPQNDLPEWVVSSLSFLSRWTDDVSSNLPHYPGVEADLLRVILQSFESIPDPLIPHVFHRLALFSVAPELLVTETNTSKHLNLNQPLPKNNLRFESIENLLTDMAAVSLVGCPSPLMPTAAHHSSRAPRQQSMIGGTHNRSASSSRYNIRLETAFVGPNNETYTTFKFEETKPPAVPRQMPPTHAFGDNSYNNYNGQQQVFSSAGRCQSVQSLVWQPMTGSSHNHSSVDQMHRSYASQSFAGGNNLRPFGSNLENIASIKHADSTSSLPVAVDLACEELRESAAVRYPQHQATQKPNLDPITSLQLTLLFMPPPERRRLQMFLRLLSRLLENKSLCQRLAPPHGDLRAVLVSMFAPVFVRAKTNEEVSAMYNRLAVERLSALLIDKHSAIFAVPDWLSGDVNGRLDRLRRLRSDFANGDVSSPISGGTPQSPATPSPRSVPAFCQRISVREFERQGSLAPAGDDPECSSPTRESLFDLLASIATNTSLSKRERAKRLKEFEKVYPDIYTEYFANSAGELEDSLNVNNKENSQQSPSSEGGSKSAPWMPRIKEPLLLKKIRARFGNEQQQ